MYCKHGIYIGGIGIDYICGYCEDNTPDEDIMPIIEEVNDLSSNSAWNDPSIAQDTSPIPF
jgi:hypothetical protein